jgi:hypothetical protein
MTRHWFNVNPPDGWLTMRQYALDHGLPYSLLYSRLNQRRLDYKRLFGKIYVPVDMNPAQFKRTGDSK